MEVTHTRESACGNPHGVNVFSTSFPNIGYFSRTSTQGKEFDMVSQYVAFLIRKYDKLKTKRAAIFIEPKLDTGYPDIVVVEYSSLPPLEWKDARQKLTITDIKILFYIQTRKNISVETVCNTLGYPSASVEKSLRRLSDSGLVGLSKSGKYARSIRLSRYCRISSLIAIEAKIDKWQEVICQADHNTWFSTESYILVNKNTCPQSVIDQCKSKGIGIIQINGTVSIDLHSKKRQFPVSYASLLFNEWIMRDCNAKEAFL